MLAFKTHAFHLFVLALLAAIPTDAAESEPASESMQESTAESTAEPAPPPPDPLVIEQLTELDYEYEIDEDGDFRLLFEVDDERSQLVWIRNRTYSVDDVAMRDVWSYAFRLSGKHVSVRLASRLLLESWNGVMGGWARDGEYVVYMVKVPADAGTALLDAAIGEVIRAADALERERSHEDVF